MSLSGLSSKPNDTFDIYFNTMKEIIMDRISNVKFVGNVDFQINIKNGQIQNVNVGEKKSIKI